MYNHTITNTCIESKHTTTKYLLVDSLNSVWEYLDREGWGMFYEHPRKDIYIRRSKCGRHQQTVQQHMAVGSQRSARGA